MNTYVIVAVLIALMMCSLALAWTGQHNRFPDLPAPEKQKPRLQHLLRFFLWLEPSSAG